MISFPNQVGPILPKCPQRQRSTVRFYREPKTYFLEIVDDRPDFTFKATAALDATIYLFEDLEFKKLSERIQKKIKPKTCFFQICFLSDF